MEKHAAGPGWKQQKDGRFRPPFLAHSNFPSALFFASLFKIFAWVFLAIGAFGAVKADQALRDISTSGDAQAAIVTGIALVTIFAACALGFFGYTVELLVAIHFDTRYEQSQQEADAIVQEMRQTQTSNSNTLTPRHMKS